MYFVIKKVREAFQLQNQECTDNITIVSSPQRDVKLERNTPSHLLPNGFNFASRRATSNGNYLNFPSPNVDPSFLSPFPYTVDTLPPVPGPYSILPSQEIFIYDSLLKVLSFSLC